MVTTTTDQIHFSGSITILTCWCGIRHGVPEQLRKEQLRQQNAGERILSVYCPLGHQHVPAGKSEADRLREQLQAEQDRSEFWTEHPDYSPDPGRTLTCSDDRRSQGPRYAGRSRGWQCSHLGYVVEGRLHLQPGV